MTYNMKTLLLNLQIFDDEHDLMIDTLHIKNFFEIKNNKIDFNTHDLYFDLKTHCNSIYHNNFNQNLNDDTYNMKINDFVENMIEHIIESCCNNVVSHKTYHMNNFNINDIASSFMILSTMIIKHNNN